MERRTNEGPMDFEYQNGTGPIDARSPFAAYANNQRMSELNTSRSPYKRSQSAFQSPARPSHTQPQHHHAATQPSSPAKSKPPVPAFNALFNTPRKVAADIDDSSAGETPKSPPRDDSDATPDTSNLRTALNKFDWTSMPALPATVNTMERPSSSSSRRDSFFGRIKSKLYSPGRGEVPRGDVVHVKDSRVRKKKSRELRHRTGRTRRHSESSCASDDDGRRHKRSRKSPRKTSASKDPQTQEPGMITQLFTFIASHPTVPHILSFYAQLAFNVFLLTALAYWIYSCWSAILEDVNKKAWEETADVIAEISQCAENYRINGCISPSRVPALNAVCNNWETCMNRDPTKLARARVTAHTFAEILNSFIEPISYKAMLFTLLLVFGCFGISNFAFGLLREKTAQTQHYNPYPWQPPPTPQRTFSGENNAFYGGTPWNMPINGLEPTPSQGFGQIEGRGSPVRRLAYG